MSNNAVIYARFSSDRQNETSIDAQVRACQEYAAKNDMLVKQTYADEAISGKGSTTKKRLAYQRMLRDAKAHKFDVILIHKYDRVARNLVEHVMLSCRLEADGVKLIAVAQDFGDTKEGKMMKGMSWLMSEYYIENLSEETRKGLRETALRGLHNGGYAPFGYDIVEQEYIINEAEAFWVRKIYDYAYHGKGYSDLIKEMEAAGVVGKRGKPIKAAQINEILHNEKYSGVYLYSLEQEKTRKDRRTKPNAIRVEGAIPAIVDKEKWEAVQKIMSEREHGAKGKYRCSGLVYCGLCGAKMHVYTSKRKGHEYHYYICSKHCGNKSVRIETVEQIADLFIKRTLTEENCKELTLAMQEYVKDEKKMLAEFEETRAEKLKDAQERYDTLLANMSSSVLPKPVIEAIGKEMESVLSEIDRIKSMKPLRSYTEEMVSNWFNAVRNASATEIDKALIERIEIANDEAKVVSTLASSLGENGCGGTQTFIPTTMQRAIQDFLCYTYKL